MGDLFFNSLSVTLIMPFCPLESCMVINSNSLVFLGNLRAFIFLESLSMESKFIQD